MSSEHQMSMLAATLRSKRSPGRARSSSSSSAVGTAVWPSAPPVERSVPAPARRHPQARHSRPARACRHAVTMDALPARRLDVRRAMGEDLADALRLVRNSSCSSSSRQRRPRRARQRPPSPCDSEEAIGEDIEWIALPAISRH